jgi:hypothetical protein
MLIVFCCVATVWLAAGCGEDDATSGGSNASNGGGRSGRVEGGSPSRGGGVSLQPDAAADDTPIDELVQPMSAYHDEAEKQIDADNVEAELKKLRKEIEKDL